MGSKLQKAYLRNCNLLIVQDLWQAHYQILLIILLKDFIRLNVKKNMILKNVKLAELNGKISTNFLNTENVKVFK